MDWLDGKTVKVLDILANCEETYQREIAIKTNLNPASVKLIVDKLEEIGIVETYLGRENGRIVKKIKLSVDPKQIKEVVENYKRAAEELENVIAALRKPSIKDERNKD